MDIRTQCPRYPHRYLRHEIMALPSTCGEGIAVAWPYKEMWYYEGRRRRIRATYKRCGKHGVTDCLVCAVTEIEGMAQVKSTRRARRRKWLADRRMLDE